MLRSPLYLGAAIVGGGVLLALSPIILAGAGIIAVAGGPDLVGYRRPGT